MTPRSTVEISIRPGGDRGLGEEGDTHTHTVQQRSTHTVSTTARPAPSQVAYAAVMGVTLQVHCDWDAAQLIPCGGESITTDICILDRLV